MIGCRNFGEYGRRVLGLVDSLLTSIMVSTLPGQLQPTAKALTGGRHGASSKPFTLYKLSVVGQGIPNAIVSGEELHGAICTDCSLETHDSAVGAGS
jgi:hypothetical protein